MTTVLDILQKGTDYLDRHGVDEARLTMQYLLAHRLDCDRMQLYVDFDRPLGDADLEVLRDWVKRRAAGEPLQHLLGSVEFSGDHYKVDARALIPRPETEELVELLIARFEKAPAPPQRVLDVGGGSGVIGLSLARHFGDSTKVLLVDVSAEALALAEENRATLEIDNATLRQSDLFAAVDADPPFDLIVANLPYIASAEIAELDVEVQRDPRAALDGGASGVELMQRFLADCPGYLASPGLIAMEFGIDQGSTLKQLAEAAGLNSVEIVKDLSGHERFLFAGNS